MIDDCIGAHSPRLYAEWFFFSLGLLSVFLLNVCSRAHASLSLCISCKLRVVFVLGALHLCEYRCYCILFNSLRVSLVCQFEKRRNVNCLLLHKVSEFLLHFALIRCAYVCIDSCGGNNSKSNDDDDDECTDYHGRVDCLAVSDSVSKNRSSSYDVYNTSRPCGHFLKQNNEVRRFSFQTKWKSIVMIWITF